MNASQSVIWNGSEFVPCNGIPPSDRGFRYGMALFESLAIRRGKVEFHGAHISRLEAACRRCGWPVDRAALTRSRDWFETMDGPVFARIYITAGDGGPASQVLAPRILLFAERRNPAAPEPLRLRLHPDPFLPVLGGLKTANYWPNIEALHQARAAGLDEALLFNPQGKLISACMANVFVKLDGRWVTPPVSCGARAGVVREWVMRRRKGVQERELTAADLEACTASFLTSCWSGVTPVSALEGRELETLFAESLQGEFLETR